MYRDYNRDGKTDWFDKLIEQELFYDDDDKDSELDEYDEDDDEDEYDDDELDDDGYYENDEF